MELKPGYRQTEVGVIPEDWKVKSLPEFSWFQEGPGIRQWQFTKSGMKVINVTNLEDGYLNLERTDRHISLLEFKRIYRHFAIDDADIVMASSGNSYGKTAIVRTEDLPLVMNTSVIRFKPLSEIDRGYLWALLNSQLFKNQINSMITGGAQPNFGPYHLKRIIAPIPPFPEQCAIAKALNDVDTLISMLDKLIVKKRDIKQAAIQELLTGKRRLPGFNDEWVVRTFGEMFDFLTTANNSRSDLSDSGCIGYIHYGDIHTGTAAFLDCNRTEMPRIHAARVSRIPTVEEGDLVMADASEDFEGLGKSVEIVNVRDQKVVAGLHTFLLRGDKRLLANGFKGYLQFIPSVRQSLIKRATGISVYGVSKNNIKSIEVNVPSITEQRAIASILFDMDAEISALEARRDKTSALKQGMTQELLTGRTRLVPAKSAQNDLEP